MTIKIFGHKSPDTDATGSAIIGAWYYSEILKKPATPYVLGELNPETKFVLDYWKVEAPEIIESVGKGDQVVIVDTNNAEELPDGLAQSEILQIIDHHRLLGNIKTSYVVNVTIRPIASTASVFAYLMTDHMDDVPEPIKGLMLSCVLSDTLKFRSPTTTQFDETLASGLAHSLGIDINEYANKMFEAKSDISGFSDEALVTMDSKVAEFSGSLYRVGVLETAAPKVLLDRKEALMAAQASVCEKENLEQAFLFIIDILNEQATLLVPNEATKQMAEKSFNCTVEGDTVILPGIVSRKKQIIPHLKV